MQSVFNIVMMEGKFVEYGKRGFIFIMVEGELVED